MGKTQNPNKSLNNTIWRFVPKILFFRQNTLRFGVYMAVCNFNNGNISICRLVEKRGLNPGTHLVTAMERLDRQREKKAKKARQEVEKKARQPQNLLKRKLEDKI